MKGKHHSSLSPRPHPCDRLEVRSISAPDLGKDPKATQEFDALQRYRGFTNLTLSYEIGRGKFSIVYKAIDKLTGAEFAVKRMNKADLTTDKHKDMVKQEIFTLRSVSHPNIIRLFDVYETDQTINMVFEYMDGGTLYTFVKDNRGGLPEDDAFHNFKEVVSGMQFLHQSGFCHRDLKPENILLSADGRRVKIADFGFSDSVSRMLTTKCGSLQYTAPEIMTEKEYDGRMADMYSLGALYFVLLTSKLPFGSCPLSSLLEKVNKIDIAFPEGFPKDTIDFIKRLMQPNPKLRVSMDVILKSEYWSIRKSRAHSARSPVYPSSPIKTNTLTLCAPDTKEDKSPRSSPSSRMLIVLGNTQEFDSISITKLDEPLSHQPPPKCKRRWFSQFLCCSGDSL